ncbi:MAG: WG repeat-containing protein [Clostridia bacterium]|nr:WG repeat-containing protein [Clostridia bacterium]
MTYKDKLKKVVKEENKGYLEYSEDYFKNISELGEDSEFYLNVKREGKWGYINSSGETKIDFEYDYATPFVTIEKYDKNFDIALVCRDEIAAVILKNKRNVMTFKNNISIDDYDLQLEKLQELYLNVFMQEGKIQDKFVSVPTSNMTTIKSYDQYPYRYPYNDEYDIYITVAQFGAKNRYEFLKRDNPSIKVSIDCDNLKFDDKNLYVFSNGFLPFYKTSENIQGWYTKETKRVVLEGNIQILEFFDSQVLIKDYDKNILYFANEDGEKISPNYKDIFVLNDAYIVKDENNKYIIIDKQFNKVLDIEYDYINPVLLEKGLLICANLPMRVNFNNSGFPSNIEYDLVDINGKKISLINKDGTVIENTAYTAVYYINNKKIISNYDLYINNLTDILYNFVGEEFYSKK